MLPPHPETTMRTKHIHWLYREITVLPGKKIYLANLIWILLACIAGTAEIARGMTSIDNFLIYRGVFNHVTQLKNLFILYPDEYESFNNYGPAFSLIIAPFALLPVYLGCWLWAMTGAVALLIAIHRLPLSMQQRLLIVWIAAIEMMTATHNVQFNTLLTAFIIFSFVFTLNGKDWLATLFIAAGTLSKVYGIAGLLFFFFSRNKIQFIVSYIFWMAVFFFLPMLYSSYDYILQTYEDWFRQILKRNDQNVFNSTYAGMQDISIMGMIRRIFGWYDFPEFKLVAAAGVLLLIPLAKIQQWQNPSLQLRYLSLALLTVVVFSSASESPSFVLAVSGAGIWLSLHPTPWKKWLIALVIFLFLFTILSPTDIVPPYIRTNFIQAYSLKALPCAIIWVCVLIEIYTIAFTKNQLRSNQIA